MIINTNYKTEESATYCVKTILESLLCRCCTMDNTCKINFFIDKKDIRKQACQHKRYLATFISVSKEFKNSIIRDSDYESVCSFICANKKLLDILFHYHINDGGCLLFIRRGNVFSPNDFFYVQAILAVKFWNDLITNCESKKSNLKLIQDFCKQVQSINKILQHEQFIGIDFAVK